MGVLLELWHHDAKVRAVALVRFAAGGTDGKHGGQGEGKHLEAQVFGIFHRAKILVERDISLKSVLTLMSAVIF
jgi:hypothetical protein